MALRGDFEQANQRAKDLGRRIPRVVSAHCDRKTRRIAIHLSSRLIVSFSPCDVEGLEGTRPSQLNEIEISPSGFGIHFPAVDADLYLPGLFFRTFFSLTRLNLTIDAAAISRTGSLGSLSSGSNFAIVA